MPCRSERQGLFSELHRCKAVGRIREGDEYLSVSSLTRPSTGTRVPSPFRYVSQPPRSHQTYPSSYTCVNYRRHDHRGWWS